MFESMGLRVRDERPLRGHAEGRAADVDLRLRRRVRRRRRARRRRGAGALPGRVHPASGAASSRTTASTASCCGRAWTGATSPCCGPSRATCGRRASPSASATWSRRCIAHPHVAAALVELFRARFDPAGDRPEAADAIAREIEEAIDAVESLDEDRILRSFLASCARCCGRTTSSRARRRTYLASSSTPRGSRCCRLRARASRSSSTRRASRACTCAAARSPAAGCAGRTAARTSARRSSA